MHREREVFGYCFWGKTKKYCVCDKQTWDLKAENIAIWVIVVSIDALWKIMISIFGNACRQKLNACHTFELCMVIGTLVTLVMHWIGTGIHYYTWWSNSTKIWYNFFYVDCYQKLMYYHSLLQYYMYVTHFTQYVFIYTIYFTYDSSRAAKDDIMVDLHHRTIYP